MVTYGYDQHMSKVNLHLPGLGKKKGLCLQLRGLIDENYGVGALGKAEFKQRHKKNLKNNWWSS